MPDQKQKTPRFKCALHGANNSHDTRHCHTPNKQVGNLMLKKDNTWCDVHEWNFSHTTAGCRQLQGDNNNSNEKKEEEKGGE